MTRWLLPSVLVLPPSLAVTLTYLPISPSRAMRKGAESTLWERIENTMKWKELENYKLETLFFHNIAFWFFPLIWTTSDLLRQLPINFQISTNHATEFPAFSTKYFQGMKGGNPCEDDRSDTSVSDPWERCLDSGLKLGVGRESGGELLLLSTCLSHNPSNPISSYHSQHVGIRSY